MTNQKVLAGLTQEGTIQHLKAYVKSMDERDPLKCVFELQLNQMLKTQAIIDE